MKKIFGHIIDIIEPESDEDDSYIVVSTRKSASFDTFTCTLNFWNRRNIALPEKGMDVVGYNVYEIDAGWRTTKLIQRS